MSASAMQGGHNEPNLANCPLNSEGKVADAIPDDEQRNHSPNSFHILSLTKKLRVFSGMSLLIHYS